MPKKKRYTVISFTEDVKKIKELQKGEKPEHLTTKQWEKWKTTGNQILKNVL